MTGSAFREAVGGWFNSPFLAGVSSIDFIWNIWTLLLTRVAKKVVAIPCRNTGMMVEGSLNWSHNSTIYQSYQFVTKHSSLSLTISSERRQLYGHFCLPPWGVVWIQRAFEIWYRTSTGTLTSSMLSHLFDVQKCPVGTLPLLLHPRLTNTCRSVLFQGASYQDISACVTCLLLVLFPQFCIAVNWLCWLADSNRYLVHCL